VWRRSRDSMAAPPEKLEKNAADASLIAALPPMATRDELRRELNARGWTCGIPKTDKKYRVSALA